MKITIKNTKGDVIIEGEYESIQDCVERNTNNLVGADLRGSNLGETDLQGANLWGADLQGSNLWGAKIMKDQKDDVLRGLGIIIE